MDSRKLMKKVKARIDPSISLPLRLLLRKRVPLLLHQLGKVMGKLMIHH